MKDKVGVGHRVSTNFYRLLNIKMNPLLVYLSSNHIEIDVSRPFKSNLFGVSLQQKRKKCKESKWKSFGKERRMPPRCKPSDLGRSRA